MVMDSQTKRIPVASCCGILIPMGFAIVDTGDKVGMKAYLQNIRNSVVRVGNNGGLKVWHKMEEH